MIRSRIAKILHLASPQSFVYLIIEFYLKSHDTNS